MQWFLPPLEVEKPVILPFELTAGSAPWQHKEPSLSEGVHTQMHSKHELAVSVGGSPALQVLPTHFYVL